MKQIKCLFLMGFLAAGISSFSIAADFPVSLTKGFIRSFIDVSGTTITVNSPDAVIPSGTTVYVQADPPPTGMRFDEWISNVPISARYTNSPTMKFKMPAQDLTLKATYRKFILIIQAATGAEERHVYSGESLTAFAPDPFAPNPQGYGFSYWLHVPQEGPIGTWNQIQVYTATATFIMPPVDTTLVAAYDVHQNLTVVGGTGSGSFVRLQFQTIIADPAPTGKIFDRWISNGPEDRFTNALQETTQVKMPKYDITVTATYTDLVLASPATPEDGFVDFTNVMSPSIPGDIPISYYLENSATVSLAIFDSRGYQVRSLAGTGNPGVVNVVSWNGNNDDGQKVSTDVYVVVLILNNTVYKTKVSVIN